MSGSIRHLAIAALAAGLLGGAWPGSPNQAAADEPGSVSPETPNSSTARRGIYFNEERGPVRQPGAPPNNEIDLRQAFAPIASAAAKATVHVLVRGEQVALGTIVSADGRIITKASELSGPASVRLPGGRIVPSKVVGVAGEYDLAMLQVDAETPSFVTFDADTPDPRVGRFIAAVGPQGAVPVAVGVVSVARRPIPADAVMGVLLTDSDKPGARVAEVMPTGGAFRAGVRRDDLIVAIDEHDIRAREDVAVALAKKIPGQRISVRVARGEEEVKLSIMLGTRIVTTRAAKQNTMGGRLSDRRAGFPAAFQHDMVNLQPADIGSAIVALDGTVVGLNIARAGRTESYGLPASVVAALVDGLSTGKYPATTQPSDGDAAPRVAAQPATRPAGKS